MVYFRSNRISCLVECCEIIWTPWNRLLGDVSYCRSLRVMEMASQLLGKHFMPELSTAIFRDIITFTKTSTTQSSTDRWVPVLRVPGILWLHSLRRLWKSPAQTMSQCVLNCWLVFKKWSRKRKYCILQLADHTIDLCWFRGGRNKELYRLIWREHIDGIQCAASLPPQKCETLAQVASWFPSFPIIHVPGFGRLQHLEQHGNAALRLCLLESILQDRTLSSCFLICFGNSIWGQKDHRPGSDFLPSSKFNHFCPMESHDVPLSPNIRSYEGWE